jgi:hypothetical protein
LEIKPQQPAEILNSGPKVNNQSVVKKENMPITITLKAIDRDGDKISYLVVQSPTHGKISSFKSSKGTITYNPVRDFIGKDTFTFKANDGKSDSNVGTISINVNGLQVTKQ